MSVTKLIFGIFAGLFFCFSATAAPMNGEPIHFTQPDGCMIQLEVFGDEYYAETRTLDGYTVFYDQQACAYFYAALSADGNEFVSSGILVDSSTAAPALKKMLTINRQSKRAKIQLRVDEDERITGQRARWNKVKESTRLRRAQELNRATDEVMDSEEMAASISPAPPSAQTIDRRVGLTILVEFPDVAGTIPQQEVDDYCNKPGYSGFSNNGSIYDYFNTQSDGRLRYHNVVTAYVMAPQPKSYYNDTTQSSGYCGRLLLNDVLQVLIAQGFDFSVCTVNESGRLHAVNMFFAGNNSGVWSRGLWPHKFSLSPDVPLGGGIYADGYQTSNMGTSLRISTFCHESGHLLCGFPDFYDYDGDSNGNGRYTLMAHSGYSNHPTSVGAYLRYHAGWAEAREIDTSSHFRAAVRVDSGALYQFYHPTADTEYFLIENRQKIGYEYGSYLPDSGLLIMHCDENGQRDDQMMVETNHYEVSIEQADGLFQLEYDENAGGLGDLFHAGGNSEFNDSTLPNAHWWGHATTSPSSGDYSGLNIHDIGDRAETMTFIVGSGPLSSSAEVGVDRSLLQPRVYLGAASASENIAIWNKQGGSLNYVVSSETPWISLSSSSGTAITESDVITISYSTAALSAGTHYGQVSVKNSSNSSDVKYVNIELYVESQPSMTASLSAISLTGAVDCLSESAVLMIDNVGESILSYSLSGPSWLAASHTVGSVIGEVDAVNISFDGTGLAVGEYNGSLSLTAPGAINPSITIPLTFTVEELLLSSPLSGNFAYQQTVTINWKSSAAMYDAVDIELWLDDALQIVIAENTPNDGSYTWLVPTALSSSSNYVVRVSCNGSASFVESGALVGWKYSNSFESGFGSWINLSGDDFDWINTSGATWSSDTGPNVASEGSRYIYVEASDPNYPNKTAFISSAFNVGTFDELELYFDYHMCGDRMGTLYLDVFDGGNWIEGVWSKSGRQHATEDSPWSTAMINLASYVSGETFQLRFRGYTGSGWSSDIAVDNMRIASYSSQTTLSHNVPVLWMLNYGLAADDATALLDSDGDGMLNWMEYAAGTSPTDANSLLKMIGAQSVADKLVVKWAAENGKTYTILHKAKLSDRDWIPGDSGLIGVEPITSHDVSDGSSSGYFKIQVE